MINPRKRKNESNEEFLKRATNEYYSNGYYISEIADKLKCDKFTIYNFIVKDKNKITTDDEREVMLSLRSQGLSYREIAAKIGKSAACVHDRIKRPAKYHIENDNYKISEKDLERIKIWYAKEGKTLSWISKQLNVPTPSIKYRLIKAGLYKPNLSKSIPLTNKEKLIIKAMRLSGKNAIEIAKSCGRDYSMVSKYIKSID